MKNLLGGQSALQFTRNVLDRLGIGRELQVIPWGQPEGEASAELDEVGGGRARQSNIGESYFASWQSDVFMLIKFYLATVILNYIQATRRETDWPGSTGRFVFFDNCINTPKASHLRQLQF